MSSEGDIITELQQPLDRRARSPVHPARPAIRQRVFPSAKSPVLRNMDSATRFLLRSVAVRHDHLPIRLANSGALVGTGDLCRSEPIHECADRLQNVIQDFGTGHRNPHVVFTRLRIAVYEAESFGATLPRGFSSITHDL